MPDSPFHLPLDLVRRARRRVLLHRRPLAVLLLAVAVLAGLQAARPTPAPTVAVLTASHDLPAGARLDAGDLSRTAMPPDAVPDGAVRDVAELADRTLAAPVRRGEVMTDARGLGPSLVARYPGQVATPVRLADPDVAAVLRPGDRVRVVTAETDANNGSTSGRELGRGVVITVPRASDGDPLAGSAGLPGRLVLLAVPEDDAPEVAAAAAALTVTVLLEP